MAFFFPAIVPKKDDKVDADRSQEFENLVGNYFITDHQRTRLSSRIIDYIKSNPHRSTFMIRSDDIEPKWYQVTVSVDEIVTKPELEESIEAVEDEEGSVVETIPDREPEDDESPPTTHFP